MPRLEDEAGDAMELFVAGVTLALVITTYLLYRLAVALVRS
jgi:hypothetical protein